MLKNKKNTRKQTTIIKKASGITLIALVVTIIVLLILAGISIMMLTGNNGILTRAGQAKEQTIVGQEKEQVELAYISAAMKKLGDNVTSEELQHELDLSVGAGKTQVEGQKTLEVLFTDTNHLYKVENGKVEKQKPVITPTETSVADASTTFPTAYGTIDVIWLNTDNSIRNTPNPPILTSNGETMTPVKWTETTGGWEDTPVETTDSDSNWYEYNAVSTREQSGATTDNNTSHWANAKTLNGAFFVWIPRYAYRITYYSNETSTEPTGYYDGWGLWKAEDGSVKLALDSGVETVTYNKKKYIVHPAFETNLDLGGWSSDLSGFWFAKYEMCWGSSYGFKSIPNTASKRSQNIGTQYVWGRQAKYGFTGTSETLSSNGTNYTYTSYMNSHMMKNSEWGAVAYLTQSQYGRNGNEIDINGNTGYITGNGSGDVGGTASTSSEIQYAYNTTTGAKASTTGNIYGIYDMSGGAWERVAAYYSEGSTTYTEGSSYGLSMTQEAKDSSGNYTSTKYITKYGGSSSSSGNKRVYTYGKIGDSTKEVNLGGQDANSAGTYRENWFGDGSTLAYSTNPFFTRGGLYSNGSRAGIFFSDYSTGPANSYTSFRTVLCP